MDVTRVKWRRAGLRRVHAENGVGQMLLGLAGDICQDAATSVGTVTGSSGKVLESVTEDYRSSMAPMLFRRRKGYFVAWAANTSRHAGWIEFGTVERFTKAGESRGKMPAFYPLTKAAHRDWGAR